jgi:tRNA(fMet)-specific endonuclease VapC
MQTLSPFVSFPFDDAAAIHYARLRHSLELTGSTIGPYDLQIAAICLLHQLTLVTSNVNEFSRVPSLIFEDWLQSP